VSTFASHLASKIKSNPKFWMDVESVWSKGIGNIIPNLQSSPKDDDTILDHVFSRYIESASIFAKSSNEHDRVLAQIPLRKNVNQDAMRAVCYGFIQQKLCNRMRYEEV